MSRIETHIKRKLGPSFDWETFDESAFDLILLEGIELFELGLEDKFYLEKFKDCKGLNLSHTCLKSLKNLPVLP